ncbi:MAG: hypothetical protein NWE88_01475 [Candidatus Bathyarchaeota archaeon]|nr:hypothetical protein [Candidatus Bathyarchaeota archaeon]
MVSDPIPEALVSIAGGFVTSLLTVISFRTFTSLGVPPGLYTSAAVISLLALILIFYGSSALCFTYVLFMFFHGYYFVDAGFIVVGMSSSMALVGGAILKSIFARRAARNKQSTFRG